MRIGILTFFESDNYGTVLQAYALQAYLMRLGHLVQIIRLNRDVFAKSPSEADYTRVYSFRQRVEYKFIHMFHKKDGSEKKETFSKFREKYLYTTERLYSNGRQIVEDVGHYDLILSGGDQIWNPYHKSFSLDYLCQFLPESFPRISYGSSFGIEHIGNNAILVQIKECLEQYRAVMIREESGVQIVEKLGIEATQVEDPVFLDSEVWNQFLTKKAPVSKPYVVVYALVDYPESDDFIIKRYAKDHRLKVVILPENRRNYLNYYQKAFAIGPESFVNYIAHCEIIFTNSFHGAAFGLLLKKRVVLLDACSNDAKNKQIRILDLFSRYNVRNYKIAELNQPFAYSSQKLEEKVEYSRHVLENALDLCGMK